MELTDGAILHLARGGLDQLESFLADQGARHQLAAVRAALHELALRGDGTFAADHYRRGFALAGEGASRTADGEARAAHAALAQELPSPVHPDLANHALVRLNACLREIVRAIGPADKDYLDRVCRWESEIGARRMAPPADAAPATHHFTRERLERYLRRRYPQRSNLRVTAFDVLSGGFSKLTALFSIRDDVSGDEPLVIRANHPLRNIRTEAADVVHEYPLLRGVYEAGLPVPEPLWLEEDESALGSRFLVSRKVRGKPIGGHTPDMTQAVTPQIRTRLLEMLLRIHRIPVSGAAPIATHTHLARWLPHRDFAAVALATTEYWMEEVAHHDAMAGPGLRRVYDWLIANPPAPRSFTPVFVHGDYGLHNLLFDAGDISAVLDWEIAKIGDPAEDFVPLFLTLNVDYDEGFIAAYVAAGGQPISRFRYYYYLLMVAFRTHLFAAAATRNLATGNANVNLFNYLHGPAYLMTHRVPEIIDKAESARRQEGSA